MNKIIKVDKLTCTLMRLLTPSSWDASNFIRCDILSGGGTSPANTDLGKEASASRAFPKRAV